MELGQSVPGRPISPQPEVSSPPQIADHQRGLNEMTFTSLNDQLETTNATCNYLEEALQSARQRREVLQSALDCLNQARAPEPSLR